MKKLLLVPIIFLCCAFQRGEQAILTQTVSGANPCAPYTDTFPSSSGTALNATYWTNYSSAFGGSSSIVQNSGVAQAATDGFTQSTELVTGCTPSATVPYVQYTMTTNSGSNNYQGPVLLANSSGNGYVAYVAVSGSTGLIKYVSGSANFLSWTTNTCGTITSGAILKFAAVVTTTAALTLSVGGTPCATYVDASTPFLSGFDGVLLNNTGTPGATKQQIATFSAD